MLTAKGETIDKVVGLDSGADDYMTKPFAIEELLARIRAALRHKQSSASGDKNVLEIKGLKIDISRHSVSYNGEEIELTKREFELLEYLVQNKNIVISRDQILNQVWGYDYIGETNVVDVYVRYLRTKIDDKFGIKIIHTIRGVGYFAKED
jgi:DNA-binding response OmpR family regulator